MDKELLKVVISEVFAAIEEAEAGHKFVVAVLKIVESVAESDVVLDKIVGLLTTKGVKVAAA